MVPIESHKAEKKKKPVEQGSVERRTRNNRDGKAIREGGFESKQEYINCQRTKLINFLKK